MADKKPLLILALTKLGQATDNVSLRDRRTDEVIPVPNLINEATGSRINLSDTFTVVLSFSGEGYDACVTTLIQAKGGLDTLRACAYQQLIFIEGLTKTVEESFSNVTIEPGFKTGETFSVQSFLRESNTNTWVATDPSTTYSVV